MKAKLKILPLEIQYLGRAYATKTLKCSYRRGNVLYKVALPSAISPISQCWFAREGLTWRPVMGQCLAPELLDAVLNALRPLGGPTRNAEKSKSQARLAFA